MQINPSKFQFMFLQTFTSNKIKPEFIQVHGAFIPHVHEMKLLEIIIDDKLKFDKQVDLLCKNAARQLNVLYRYKGIFEQRENIYNTLSYQILTTVL